MRIAWLIRQAIKKTRAENLLIMEIRRNNRKRGSMNLEIGFDASANSCLFYWCRAEAKREESRDIHVPQNSLGREFNDHWHSHGHIVQKKDVFFAQSIPLPPPLPSSQYSQALVFDISVQRPWSLARGGANELQQYVTQKHVVISNACVKVYAVNPETK